MDCAYPDPSFWEHKINNLCEGWNNNISRLVGLSHPTIWNCIATLQKDVSSSSCTNWANKKSASSSLYIQLFVQGCETFACDITAEICFVWMSCGRAPITCGSKGLNNI